MHSGIQQDAMVIQLHQPRTRPDIWVWIQVLNVHGPD
jgi:hypothetical protein